MLTCDVCGEELLLEEDLKTHLLLSHLEDEGRCPLCPLSGVSYDELGLHLHRAHPEARDAAPAAAHAPGSLASSDRSGAGGEGSGPSPGESREPCRGSSPDASPATTREKKQRHGNAGGVEKKKRMSSPVKERQLFCPICPFVGSDSFILQEHVELHLEPASAAQGGSRLQCPMCSVVCSDGVSLQEHVELHLEPGAAANASPGSDLELAHRLQDEEEERRKEEEARVEKEQFQKLQRQFGLDGGGGYRKQAEQRLERAVARGLMDPAQFHCKRAEMMESLASGQDDGKTRTTGALPALSRFYQSEARDCAHVWLSADTDHFCSSEGDRGWGCGYRNLQMMLSCLLGLEEYAAVLPDMAVPSVPRVQSLIEAAWSEGLDPHGASHFNRRLQGTRAWIGATEIYSLLTSLRVRARIVDFHQPSGPADTHPRLFQWVRQYFCPNSSRLQPRIVHTKKPPLYLQHQGHSRTVVGLEQKRSGALCLLILDPAAPSSDLRRLLSPDSAPAALRQIRRFPSGLKHRQYQLVAAEGALSEQDKRTRVLNSRSLRAERIP